MSKYVSGLGALLLATLASAPAAAANKRICVEVVLQRATAKAPAAPPKDPPKEAPAEGAKDAPAESAKDAPKPEPPKVDTGVVVAGSEADVVPPLGAERARANLPIGQRPLAYLKRLLEHFVSHEKGFEAVSSGCEQTMRVELYPLVDGWTAFARYSGTGREERVDRLGVGELSQFAERAATSLLYGKPISATINRETVLSADSKEYTQRIGGSSHFMLGVGTQLRGGRIATAASDGGVESQIRLFSPVSFFTGYRGRFESWGLEASLFGALGTSKTSIAKNPAGGHIDLAGDGALQLHFLHYFDPRGLVSFYLGAGTTFELLVFQAIKAEKARETGTRSWLLGGGLDVDVVFGWEFMRASGAQFFLQGELQAPAYALANENTDGGVHTWFPAVGLKLGVMF